VVTELSVESQRRYLVVEQTRRQCLSGSHVCCHVQPKIITPRCYGVVKEIPVLLLWDIVFAGT
jgi:hypothetical protein